MTKKVAITGMGVVSPVGIGAGCFWGALCSGTDGIGSITVCNLADFAFQQGGEIGKFVLPAKLAEKASKLDRATQLALIAVNEAWNNAGLASGEETGIVMATNFASACSLDRELGTDVDKITGNLGFMDAANAIAEIWKCNGPATCLSLSCSSGTAAIGYGADLIKSGQCSKVLAGGYDAISRFAWAGLGVLRTMTQDKIRPFSKNRSGTLFSEGAGIVVLEELEAAKSRGVEICAEVAGFGFNNNAYHMTAPAKEGKGLADAMSMALKASALKPEEIDHVNTHGTGTKFNDVTETQAIKSVLGKHASTVPITSIKSMTGHMMGAAGSIETIAAAMSINTEVIPPTINFEEPDPECDLPLPTDKALDKEINNVICNSSGIGGNNATLVLSKV